MGGWVGGSRSSEWSKLPAEQNNSLTMAMFHYNKYYYYYYYLYYFFLLIFILIKDPCGYTYSDNTHTGHKWHEKKKRTDKQTYQAILLSSHSALHRGTVVVAHVAHLAAQTGVLLLPAGQQLETLSRGPFRASNSLLPRTTGRERVVIDGDVGTAQRGRRSKRVVQHSLVLDHADLVVDGVELVLQQLGDVVDAAVSAGVHAGLGVGGP